jgi:DNA-3-methyladenine glycosylase
MRRRRGLPQGDAAALCRGPGNLTKALGISLAQNRADLTGATLSIEDWGLVAGAETWGPRIGIRVGAERPWRCWIAGNPSVSGPRGPVVPSKTRR